MQASVIMPCHNAGRWVVAALHSIEAQTLAPHEIIVINDRSSDDSVEQIQKSGVPVKLLHTDFGNAAAARNFGVDHATGDWIAFLDADDMWYPHHLEKAAGLLRGTNDVGYTAYDHYLYEGDEVLLTENRWPIDTPTSGLTHRDYMRCWNTYLKFATGPTLVRRDRFLEVGGFDPEQVRRHDFEMWLRVIYDHTWSYNPRPVSIYRADNAGSISRTSWANSEYYMLRALVKNQPAYGKLGLDPIIRATASRALSSALTDGDSEDLARVRSLAWPQLPAFRRLVFALAMVAPPLFRALNARRRAKLKRGRRESGSYIPLTEALAQPA
ncbi:MAG: glycosyltransferase family A protein [Phycisphaeraceae bacterium]